MLKRFKLFLCALIIFTFYMYPASGTTSHTYKLGSPLINSGSINNFYSHINKLKKNGKNKIKVLFIGDSHIQADFFTGHIREVLGSRYGYSGRGYITPPDYLGAPDQLHVSTRISDDWYSISARYSAKHKELSNIYGLSMRKHIAIQKNAFIKISTDKIVTTSAEIWYISHSNGGEIEIYINNKKHSILSLKGDIYKTARHIVTSDDAINSLKIVSLQNIRIGDNSGNNVQKWNTAPVQILGFVLENKSPGVTIDAAGLNGARISTAVLCNRDEIKRQIKYRGYNLVVICFGANDILYRKLSPLRIKKNFFEVHSRISEVLDNCGVLYISAPDMLPAMTSIPNYKSIIPKNIKILNNLLNNIINKHNAALWDQQSAMGGEGSVFYWQSNKLFHTDYIHFTKRGYALLGDLFLNSLLSIPVPNYKLCKE